MVNLSTPLVPLTPLPRASIVEMGRSLAPEIPAHCWSSYTAITSGKVQVRRIPRQPGIEAADIKPAVTAVAQLQLPSRSNSAGAAAATGERSQFWALSDQSVSDVPRPDMPLDTSKAFGLLCRWSRASAWALTSRSRSCEQQRAYRGLSQGWRMLNPIDSQSNRARTPIPT